jgi:hemerythrin-like domain-containing protein
MCEYCGCQAVSAIADLTAEHDAVVDRIGHVRKAVLDGDTARAAELARGIADVLVPHTAVEELGLFPAMAPEFPDAVAGLQAEHRLVASVLGEAAAGTPADESWPGRLVEVLAMLCKHIHKEQDGVFPAALTTLGPDEWDSVDRVRAEVGCALPAGVGGAR